MPASFVHRSSALCSEIFHSQRMGFRIQAYIVREHIWQDVSAEMRSRIGRWVHPVCMVLASCRGGVACKSCMHSFLEEMLAMPNSICLGQVL